MAEKDQIIRVHFFEFNGWRQRWWAFQQMGLALPHLAKGKGLEFVKLLGSGDGNGFGVLPNWGVYGLLHVWTNEQVMRTYEQDNQRFAAFKRRSSSWRSLTLRCAKAHGTWDGTEPFRETIAYDQTAPVAVVTRARIYLRHVWRFWQFVRPVSADVEQRPGLQFSIGVGELPIVQLMTFSIWDNSLAMMNYAYQREDHRNIIRRTRENGWYKEELFARFHIVDQTGEWT